MVMPSYTEGKQVHTTATLQQARLTFCLIAKQWWKKTKTGSKFKFVHSEQKCGVRMFAWQPRNNMAAPVPLLPLDSSLPSSVLSFGGDGVSSARQRRRKTTKKPGVDKLAKSAIILGERGLELDTLESHGSEASGDWPSAPRRVQKEGRTVNGSVVNGTGRKCKKR